MSNIATLYKATALFIGVFAVQLLVVPDFFWSQFFQDGSYSLEQTEYNLMRALGCAWMVMAMNYWRNSEHADDCLLQDTVVLAVMWAVTDLHVLFTTPVKQPRYNIVAVAGQGLILVGHLYFIFKKQQQSKTK
jgi:hypothetical protein